MILREEMEKRNNNSRLGKAAGLKVTAGKEFTAENSLGLLNPAQNGTIADKRVSVTSSRASEAVTTKDLHSNQDEGNQSELEYDVCKQKYDEVRRKLDSIRR